jgi:excisionase family DNA binding protein
MGKNVQDSLSIKEAAEQLGLTQEAIRKRLQRNKIKGFKLKDGTWRIILDNGFNTSRTSTGRVPGQRGQEEIISLLKDEISFLREQLSTRDDEIKRAHVLLQQGQTKAISNENIKAKGFLKKFFRR